MPDKFDDLRARVQCLKRDADALAQEIEQFAGVPRGGRSALTEAELLRIVERAIDIYEAQSPRPPHVTIKEAAKTLGLSRQTVSKMLHAGQFKHNKCGLIPIEQIDAALASRASDA
ncbi:helix-turn-helix domain-containing protein [Paraburkholderia sp.]|uniref:helix-turn-helix domain-containing protein n=1 Tax=Paraburkholderia sp. TaxID=1926495 RepID=UPI0039E489C5